MASWEARGVALTLFFVVLGGGCGGGGDPLENAQVLVDLGKYDKALEVLDAALLNDPKNVDVYLLKGRVYLGLADLENADDAFGDAIAVGGKSAARKIDEAVLVQFKRGLEEYFPPDDRAEQTLFLSAVDSLRLLNEDELKRDAFRLALERLVEQDDQQAKSYNDLAREFMERANLEREAVRDEGMTAIEKLAKRAGDGVQFKTTTQELIRGAPDEDRVRIEKILAKYQTDIDRARETMGKMRSIGTATEAFAVDYAKYPQENSLANIRPLIEPTYIRVVPTTDGWGTEFEVRSVETHYVIVSAGSDKSFENSHLDPTNLRTVGTTVGFEKDIIYSNGSFVQYPEGVGLD